MWRHYILSSWRNLKRNKLFSGLNVLGLAIGMAGAILIGIWVQNMLSYDRFHKNENQLYVICNLDQLSGGPKASTVTPIILGPEFEEVNPEVSEMTRVLNGQRILFANGEKRIIGENGSFVDPDFFRMFSFPMLEGGVNKDWENGKGIVLTKAFARAIFGDEDPLGKTVKLDSSDYVTVTGILKDFPSNTRFKSPYFLSWRYAPDIDPAENRWGSNTVNTFVKLAAGTDLTTFNNKIRDFTHNHADGIATKNFAEPLKNMYLYNQDENGKFMTGRIVLVRCIIGIGLLLLLIACINFMNLSTAQSEKRSKEVGVKKVIGASRRKIAIQFLTESTMISFFAFVFAMGLVLLLLPAFSILIETELRINFGWLEWLIAILFILFTGMLAGCYPAFYLSSFKPATVLKGSFRRVISKLNPRSMLVVLQFTVAIILILTTVMITSDIVYVQNRDKGYAQKGLVFTNLSGDLQKNYLPLRNELLTSGAVTSVTKNFAPVTMRMNSGSGLEWPGSTETDQRTEFLRYSTDADMIRTMGMQLIEGRDIDIYKYPTDSTAMLLTASAVRAMHLKSPIGSIVHDKRVDWTVVGVIKDFIIERPTDNINPMVIGGPKSFFTTMHFRLNPDKPIKDNITTIQKIFNKYNPEFPFQYSFVDMSYSEKFKDTKRVAQLSFLFAGLTIFISCLGLFGLVCYLAEGKKKEIGIRKVLGSSIVGIIRLLSKGFLKLILLSFIIAVPIALYVMNRWLGNSAYSVGISWWWFAVTILGTLVISFGTVSFEALKAARANPAISLKSE